jgi:hypothetical protein
VKRSSKWKFRNLKKYSYKAIFNRKVKKRLQREAKHEFVPLYEVIKDATIERLDLDVNSPENNFLGVKKNPKKKVIHGKYICET